MDFRAVAIAWSAGEVGWLSGLRRPSTVVERMHGQHRLPEWSSSSLPHPMQSMLSWTPEHFRQAGKRVEAAGQDALVAAGAGASGSFGLLVAVAADGGVWLCR